MLELKFAKQTEKSCLTAVKRNGYALRYVSIKSEAVLAVATVYRDEYAAACKE